MLTSSHPTNRTSRDTFLAGGGNFILAWSCAALAAEDPLRQPPSHSSKAGANVASLIGAATVAETDDGDDDAGSSDGGGGGNPSSMTASKTSFTIKISSTPSPSPSSHSFNFTATSSRTSGRSSNAASPVVRSAGAQDPVSASNGDSLSCSSSPSSFDEADWTEMHDSSSSSAVSQNCQFFFLLGNLLMLQIS